MKAWNAASAVCVAYGHLVRPEGQWAWLDSYAASHATVDLLHVDSANARRHGHVLYEVRANSQLFLRDYVG
jgi:hypothetical protein